MLALEVRSTRLAISAAATTLALGVALGGAGDGRRCPAADTPAMPAPAPAPVVVREARAAPLTCEDPSVQTVVFKGRVNAIGDDRMMTFHFRFADLPDRYTVMTGPHGEFEVRVARGELAHLDLCTLPTSGERPAQFRDAQLSIEYTLAFEH